MKKFSSNLKLAICAAMLTAGVFTACKKDEVTVTPPDPIGGFNNSNEVGGSNLKAHWTFDGTAKEAISATDPTTNSRSSFVTGVKGQAISLDSGYLLYPTIAALNVANIGSVTVSCWINTTNNGSKASNVFSLTQGTAAQTDWNTGAVNMLVETGHPIATNDTLALHPSFSTYPSGPGSRLGGDNINDYGVREVDFKTVHGTGKWIHYVMRYDATGSNIDVFADGIVVSNSNFRHRTTGTPAVGIGPIITTTPTQPLIGAFPNAATGFALSPVQGFQGMFRGSIDELRFFTTALSDADISALYQLEKAGR